MEPLHEALRLIKRQTELENAMRRPGREPGPIGVALETRAAYVTPSAGIHTGTCLCGGVQYRVAGPLRGCEGPGRMASIASDPACEAITGRAAAPSIDCSPRPNTLEGTVM